MILTYWMVNSCKFPNLTCLSPSISRCVVFDYTSYVCVLKCHLQPSHWLTRKPLIENHFTIPSISSSPRRKNSFAEMVGESSHVLGGYRIIPYYQPTLRTQYTILYIYIFIYLYWILTYRICTQHSATVPLKEINILLNVWQMVQPSQLGPDWSGAGKKKHVQKDEVLPPKVTYII